MLKWNTTLAICSLFSQTTDTGLLTSHSLIISCSMLDDFSRVTHGEVRVTTALNSESFVSRVTHGDVRVTTALNSESFVSRVTHGDVRVTTALNSESFVSQVIHGDVRVTTALI